MKKLTNLFLMALLGLSLVACGTRGKDGKDGEGKAGADAKDLNKEWRNALFGKQLILTVTAPAAAAPFNAASVGAGAQPNLCFQIGSDGLVSNFGAIANAALNPVNTGKMTIVNPGNTVAAADVTMSVVSEGHFSALFIPSANGPGLTNVVDAGVGFDVALTPTSAADISKGTFTAKAYEQNGHTTQVISGTYRVM